MSIVFLRNIVDHFATNISIASPSRHITAVLHDTENGVIVLARLQERVTGGLGRTLKTFRYIVSKRSGMILRDGRVIRVQEEADFLKRELVCSCSRSV